MLPASLDAERATLGGILLSAEGFPSVAEILSPDDFSHDAHRRLFGAMGKLAGRGSEIDPVLVTEELLRAGEFEIIGGGTFLASLTENLPRATNVRFYARVVKDKALLRRQIHLLNSLLAQASDAAANPYELQEVISATLLQTVAAQTTIPFRTGAEIEAEMPPNMEWLARPWATPGAITELTGKIKAAGKTTWLLALCRAVVEGSDFMGERTAQTGALYLTEQPEASFRPAMVRAGLMGRSDFTVLYWRDTVRLPWPTVMHQAVAECKRRGLRLVVVDTLAQFAGLVGDSENNCGDALRAIQPLQLAAGEGLAVMVARHERKSGGEVGDSGRGSSAFGGAVDTILSLRRPEGNSRPTMRVIRGLSRFAEVPDELVIDYVDGRYTALGTGEAVAAQEAEQVLMKALPDSDSEGLTVDDLCKATELKRSTAQQGIRTLLGRKWLEQTGKGKRGDPHRYRRNSFPPYRVGVAAERNVA